MADDRFSQGAGTHRLDGGDDQKVVELAAFKPVRELPSRIVSPASRALDFVVSALLQQHGQFGAYDQLLDAAERVRPAEDSNGQKVR